MLQNSLGKEHMKTVGQSLIPSLCWFRSTIANRSYLHFCPALKHWANSILTTTGLLNVITSSPTPLFWGVLMRHYLHLLLTKPWRPVWCALPDSWESLENPFEHFCGYNLQNTVLKWDINDPSRNTCASHHLTVTALPGCSHQSLHQSGGKSLNFSEPHFPICKMRIPLLLSSLFIL